MPALRPLVAVAVLLLLSIGANATIYTRENGTNATSSGNNGGGDDPSDYGDGDLPGYIGSLLRNHPNATGTYPVPGFDISRPYSANGSSRIDQGWSLRVAVAGPVRLRDNASQSVTDGKPRIANPSDVSLQISRDSFQLDEQDPGWSVCAWFWHDGLDDRASIEALQRDDPDGLCNGALSAECIQMLENFAVEDGGRCGFMVPKDEGKCGGKLRMGLSTISGGESFRHAINIDVRQDNGSMNFIAGKFSPYTTSDDQKVIQEQYDTAVTGAFPVLLSYNWQDRKSGGKGNQTFPFMRCLRARDITPGSRVPQTLGSRSDAMTVGSPTGVPLFGVLIHAGMASLAALFL